MKKRNALVLVLLAFINFGCMSTSKTIIVEVKNNLNLDRNFETIEVDLTNIKTLNEDTKSYKVIDIETNLEIITQLVDVTNDGNPDVLLFQPEIKANATKQFSIVPLNTNNDTLPMRCYSRFVPERTDDYAWENNRVAFRTYGPTAQKMVEDGVKGGTLSSGIDAWLKRVEYSIIDKWYEKYVNKTGSYHEDTGEGLDNFHVGVSRGIGGISYKADTTYVFSKNFISWKTITNGPIRTSFTLEYDTWDANGKSIKETKHISLDYGQNLSKFEIDIEGVDNISAGITLHKQDGEVYMNNDHGFVSYWEPLDDSELGMGLVSVNNFLGAEKYVTSKTDESNLYMHLKVNNDKVTYYTGFGWKKSGQFNTHEDWKKYLSVFSEKVNNPLQVSIKTN